MKINIKCTAVEFAALVRECARASANCYCNGCVFSDACADRSPCGIEHIVAFEHCEGESNG